MRLIQQSHLDRWAGSITTRATLPYWVGRLILATVERPLEFRFPSHDNIGMPGYDGRLHIVIAAPPFVPGGISVWEMGISEDVQKKANFDYRKRSSGNFATVSSRTRATADVSHRDTTFVFVTPRKWPDKYHWIRERKNDAVWRDVRVIDGEDLLQWLEHSPAVSLDFCSELGISPPYKFLKIPTRKWHDRLPPSSLLDPAFEAVPFQERETLCSDIEDWAITGKWVSLRVYTAQGGMGKTRLFVEMCKRMHQRHGWDAGFIGTDIFETGEETLRRLLTSSQKLFLVIDYAQVHISFISHLLRVASEEEPNDRRTCIILLARSEGDWLSQLTEDKFAARILGSQTVPITFSLESIEFTLQDRRKIFDSALAAFGQHLSVAIANPEPPDLSGHQYNSFLFILIAAYLQMMGSAKDTEIEALNEVLRHERRYWRLALLQVDLGTSLLQQAGVLMGMFTLSIRPQNYRDSAILVAKTPGFRDQTETAHIALARVFGDLYPGTGGVLQPDRLSEHLVYEEIVLKGNDELLDIVLSKENDDSQHLHALTVLNRVATSYKSAIHILELRLRKDFLHLANVALTVAIQEPGEIVNVLFTLVQESATVELLAQFETRLPRQTVHLRLLAALVETLLRDIFASISEGEDEAVLVELARTSTNLSARLVEIGRVADSIEVARDAVKICRQLVRMDVASHQLGLARALTNLSSALVEHGEFEDVEQFLEEAIRIYRNVVDIGEVTYLDELANVLTNHGTLLKELGKSHDALEALVEAVDIRRELSRKDGDVYSIHEAGLSMSLNNLAGVLMSLERKDEGYSAISEAVQIRRNLNEANDDALLPELAQSLQGEADALLELGRFREALRSADESVSINRTLSRLYRPAFSFGLAKALNVEGAVLERLGDLNGARKCYNEGVEICRSLHNENSGAILIQLAMMLGNVGRVCRLTGEKAECLSAFEEAVEVLCGIFLAAPLVHMWLMEPLVKDYCRAAQESRIVPRFGLVRPIFDKMMEMQGR